MLVANPLEFNAERLFVDLRPALGHPLFLKCEGLNFAGSIKMKAALAMVEAAERSGRLRPGSVLVESSSGNLGVALSMIAASKGYGFVCVTDVRCNPASGRMMEALGARVHVIREPDPKGGFLGARIGYVRALCASASRYVWLDQYSSPDNWGAHFRTTAPAIAEEFPELDVVFVGRGHDGHADGLRPLLPAVAPARARRRRRHRGLGDLRWCIRAEDDPRPGHGRAPAQLDEEFVDDVVLVDEEDTSPDVPQHGAPRVPLRRLDRHGCEWRTTWLAAYGPRLTAVAIAPDLGERYLDTVYHDGWVENVFGADRC